MKKEEEGKTEHKIITSITKKDIRETTLVIEECCFHLNKNVLEQSERKILGNMNKKQEKRRRKIFAYLELYHKAEETLWKQLHII